MDVLDDTSHSDIISDDDLRGRSDTKKKCICFVLFFVFVVVVVAILNGIVFLVSFSDSLLLVY